MRPDHPSRFYLARHGLTGANLGRDRGAWENEPLLPEGKEQVGILAEKVRGLDIRRIWSSPLDRARETAEIIAATCGLPLSIDDGLREIGSDHWVGKAPPGSPVEEPMEAATERVTSTLERILDRGEPFLAVSHLGPIRIARIVFGGDSWDRFREIFQGNCALLEFRRGEAGWEVVEC